MGNWISLVDRNVGITFFIIVKELFVFDHKPKHSGDIMTDWMAITNIIAVILGPISAVQIQKWIEKYTEKRNRRLNIFITLMATRGQRLSFEHVRVLNMIDIEFYGEQQILDSWQDYLNCLSTKINEEYTKKEVDDWSEKKDNSFIKLLSEMANLLNYKFDSDHLKKGFYLPTAHGKEEEYQNFVRGEIIKIFSEKTSIPVKITGLPDVGNSE